MLLGIFGVLISMFQIQSTELIAKELPSLTLKYPLEAPPSLSSTFGTYRINHHHAGLDLYGREGTPVLAAADGEISMIKRGSSGYGRAIYLKHPGEFITLYGHMSAFAPEIEALLIRSKQVKSNKFNFKIRPRERFKVKAGQIIGYLGTSGTDLMHLHFELRYKNTPINPLTHGLNLPDTQAPTLIKLYATPFGEEASIDGEMGMKAYPLSPRPQRLLQPATAIFPPSDLLPSSSGSTSQTNSKKHEPHLEIWGDVRLSLEVEDRIDGSARELTPYEIILEIDGKIVHHLKYDESTYTHPRSSELDFDLDKRGPEKALVHRLYQYEDRFRTLQRSSRSPLKNLRKGNHSGRIIAIDAAKNHSEQRFTLTVQRPPKPSCGLKKARLASLKMRRPRSSKIIDIDQLSWRPYGFTAPLTVLGINDFECLTGKELLADVRWNGERAPRNSVQITQLNGKPALSFDLRKLKLGAKTRDPAQVKEKAKTNKTKDKTKEDQELPVDHSALLWIGLKRLDEVQWSHLKLHEVRSEMSFSSRHQRRDVKVEISENAPFMPYLTAMKIHTFTQQELEHFKANGFEPLSPLYQWAQGWLPMRKGNLITIPKQGKPSKRSGAYLADYEHWWWVTSRWGEGEVTASSTHLSAFAVLKDLDPPKIGNPCWMLKPPLGPRLSVPLSDLGAGLGKIKAKLDGQDFAYELQPAWGRLLYRPREAVKPGSHRLWLAVKDKAGHLTERTLNLVWPPPDQQHCGVEIENQLTPKSK